MDVYAGGLAGVTVSIGINHLIGKYYNDLNSNLAKDFLAYRKKRIKAKTQLSAN
jgi:hypothetical protein